MIESSSKAKNESSSYSCYVSQIVEMILDTQGSRNSLDASTLLLSLSKGSHSIATQFFSTYPHYQIKVLSKFPITDPVCSPILDLFINMTSYECFADSLTPEVIHFFIDHITSDKIHGTTELICKIFNNLSCNAKNIDTINHLIPRFLFLLTENAHKSSCLDYLISAIGNSCIFESSRLVLVDNFSLFMRFLNVSINTPRIFQLSASVLKNCMFQHEFRDAFVKDRSKTGIKFIIASLLLPGISPETFAKDIPELLHILPPHIQGEQALKSNLEALLLLCTDLSGRIFLRNINVYEFLKRVHLLSDDPNIKEIIQDIVGLLIRDEV